MRSIKKLILDLGSSFAQGKLIESLSVAGASLVPIAFSPFVSIPILFTAYALYYYGKEKLSADDQKTQLDELMKRILNEHASRLTQLRETQITELEKILNCYLTAKATHEELSELKDFVIETMTNQQKTLDLIVKETQFSETEICLLLNNSKEILSGIEQIDKNIAALSACVSDIQTSLQELSTKNDKIDKFITENCFSDTQFTLANFSSNTSFPKVKTIFSASRQDKSLDNAIDFIIQMIEKGNYEEAFHKTTEIFSDVKYQGSHELIAWKHALWACIYYYQYDGEKGNEEAEKSEKSFNKAALNSIPTFLAVIYARRHISSDDLDTAKVILERSISENYSSEAKALLLSISKTSVAEDKETLTESELEKATINVVLARKSLNEGNIEDAILFARKAYDSAKGNHIVPPADVYADSLFRKKFPAGMVTAGFMRSYIAEREWPDAIQIIDLYKECLNFLSERTSDKARSFFLYNIALVYFVCGKEAEAAHYAQKFFDQNEIIENAIELCAIILLKSKDVKQCLCNLEKFEKSLPDDALCLYGTLLMDFDSGISKGINILEQVIDKSCIANSLSTFCAAMRLGAHWIENGENEKIASLSERLQNKNDYLSYYALAAKQNEKRSSDECKKNLLDLIPYIPTGLHERGKIVAVLTPLFCKVDLFSELIQLMDCYVPTDEITETGKTYFNLALKAKDQARIKKFGQALRSAGIWDQEFLIAELNFTISYSKFEAEQLANECLKLVTDLPNKQLLQTFRDMVAIETGNFHAYSHKLTDYPSIEKISSDTSLYPYVNVPIILKEMGLTEDAIKYAYGLFIRYPQNHDVRTKFFSLIMGHDEIECLEAPGLINENAAFRYRSLLDSTSRLVIVEQYPVIGSVFKPQQDKLVQMLWNKKLGYQFTISPFANRPEFEISQVLNKYVAAAQQIMDEDSLTPGSGISVIHTPIDAEGNIDVSAIFESTQQLNKIQQQKIDNATEFYQRHIRSLYVFAKIADFDILKTIRFFAQSSEMSIEAATGSLQERVETISFLEKTKKILISPLTLDLLIAFEAETGIDILKRIIDTGMILYMSEYLYEERFISDFGPVSFKKLYNDGTQVEITDDNFGKKCYEKSLELKKYISENVQIIKGDLLDSDFTQEENNKGKGIIGKALYHTMSIVNGNDEIILWDDDSPIVSIFNQSYNWKISHRIFSQAIFIFLESKQGLTSAEYVKTVIFLLTLNEKFTSFDKNIIFEAFFRYEHYRYLCERISCYFERFALERDSLAHVLLGAMLMFFTQYSNLRRSKEGLVILYKNAVKQDQDLLEQILYHASFEALKINKQKAMPIVKHLITALQETISPKIRYKIMKLFEII